MEIAENSEHRIEITQNLGIGEIFGRLIIFLVGAFVVAVGSAAIFVEASDIVAPNWAEVQGWSGDRWHSVTGSSGYRWNAEDGTPVAHVWSILLSVLVVAIGLIFVLYGSTLLVSARQHLVFDLEAGQVVFSRWGLLQCPNKTYALSDISADIETGTDEGGGMYQSLSVTVGQDGDQPDTNGRRPQRKTLFLETCTPDQVLALYRLLQAIPSTARPLPLPAKAAPAP